MTGALPRILALALTMTLVACSAFAPADFLHTPVAAADKWLNELIDVDLHNIPLADLPNRGPFRGMKLVLTGVDGDALITLQAEHVSRRQALWTLAERYGLSMTTTPTGDQPTVIIANRVLRRENTPLK